MYQLISFFHEILFFFISSFPYFPLHVKMIIIFFIYLCDCKPTNAYYSLSNEYLSSSCTIDLDLIPSCEPIDKVEVYVSISPEVDSYCKPMDYEVDISYEVLVDPCNQPVDLCVHPIEDQLRII
jgi:hypothetical protein